MGFTDSLSEFDFLSELYVRDAPDTVLLCEYPSSNSTETRFRNTDQYQIHDPFPPPDRAVLKILGPHHLMCGWGGHVPVCSEVRPPKGLFDHWRAVFGPKGVPHWQGYGDEKCYTTIFPHQSVPGAQQEIDPNVLYELHSKAAIGEIDCPQADILDAISPPCVVKLSHGYAGLGNFFVRTSEDAHNAKTYTAQHWPKAQCVINALLENIVGDYGVQFYLDRGGKVHWLGFTSQVFDAAQKWSGGIFNQSEQDQLLPEFIPFTEPTAAYLHDKGYYGLVGIDILKDKAGRLFLVDLNPRLTGITPFLIASRLFVKDGYTSGIYTSSLVFSGTLKDMVCLAEKTKTARIVIFSAAEDAQNGTTTCHVSVSANTLATCQQVLQHIRVGVPK